MPAESPAVTPMPRLTRTQWLMVVIAAIGFAFDIYELLMLPLIVRPALQELINVQPGTPEFEYWVGILFFIPAFAGGIFGLLGGYMTDLFGRRRVLVWSILLYAFSAFAAGFSTSVEMLLFFRCTTFVGVCVEFVAAVAWLAELFPEPRQREKVLGYTQAFSSLGGLMVAGANWLAVSYAKDLPAIVIPEFMANWWGSISIPHSGWRYTLISGVVPALPLIIVRPFMPESPAWARKKAEGTLKRPSLLELFRPEFRTTTIVTSIMFALSYGAAFGAIQHIPRIVPGLPEVKAQVEAETKELTEEKAQKAKKSEIEQKTASQVQTAQEIGGLTGRFILAYLAVIIVSRRSLLRIFQIPGLIIVPLVFLYPAVNSLYLLYAGIFLAGLLTVAQFSFWGNYLRMYPVHLRGTGESFAANVGGRMFGTSFAWVTTTIAAASPFAGQPPTTQLAWTAAAVALFVYAAGSVACFFLPEPKREME